MQITKGSISGRKSKHYTNEDKTFLSTTKNLIEDFKAPLLVKLTLFSIDNNFSPKLLQFFTYFCSQFQILSVLASSALISTTTKDNWFEQALKTIYQVFSVGELLNFSQSASLALFCMIIIAVLILFLIFCFSYLLISLKIKHVPSKGLQKLWCIVVNTYPSILFYPIHDIALKVAWFINENEGWADSLGAANRPLRIVIYLLITMNFFIAFGIIALVKIPAKTKNVLSASTNHIEIIDLVIKTLIPILLIFRPNSGGMMIFMLVINLVACLFRDLLFFLFLPYYKIQTLKIAVKCHAILTIFAFSAIFPKVISHNKVEDNLDFVALLWITIAPFYLYSYTKCFNSIMLSIVTKPKSKTNHYHLLHFWDMYKYLSARCKSPRPKASMVDEKYFYYYMALNQPSRPDNQGLTSLNENSQQNINEIDNSIFSLSMKLIEAASHRSSEKWLLKATLARYYLKYESLYILADDLVNEELKRSLFSTQSAPLYLVKLQLLTRLYRKSNEGGVEDKDYEKDDKKQLNVQMYLNSLRVYNKLKQSIIEQLKPQMKFWEIFELNQIDAFSLIELAKEVFNKAKKIRNLWYKHQSIYTYFTKPFLIYGFYLSFAQNDLESGDNMILEYHNDQVKKKKKKEMFNDEDDINKQLFASNTLYFTISGAPSSLGKVLDCSSSVSNYFGVQREYLIGKSMNILLPPFIAERHDGLLKASHEVIESKILNKSREVFLLDKKGYLSHCWLHIALRFLPEHGLCYYALLKPQYIHKEIVVVNTEGHILGLSEEFANDIGLKNQIDMASINIYSLSPELEEVVYAFVSNKLTKGDNTSALKSYPKLQSQGTHSQSQLSSPKTKGSYVEYLDTRTNIEADYFQSLYERFIKGDYLTFSPLQKKGQKVAPVHYFTKVGMSTNGDNFIFKLTLVKVNHYDSNFITNAVDTTNELGSPGVLRFAQKKRFKIAAKNGRSSTQAADISKLRTLDPLSATIKESIFKRHSQAQEQSSGLFEESASQRKGSMPKISSMTLLPRKVEYSPTHKDYEQNNDIMTSGRKFITAEGFDNASSSPRMREDLKLANFPSTRSRINSWDGKRELLNTKEIFTKRLETKNQVNIAEGDTYDPKYETFSDDAPLKMLSPVSSQNDYKIDLRKVKDQHENHNKKIIDTDFVEKQIAKRAKYEDEFGAIDKIKAHKTLKIISQSRKYKRSVIIYIFVFILTILTQIASLTWFNLASLDASNTSASTTKVLKAIQFRRLWMNLGCQETRFYNAVTSGWLSWPFSDQVATTNKSWHMTNQFNHDLMRAVDNLRPEIQAQFYEKNVNVYGRAPNGTKIVISVDNNFKIVDKVLIAGFSNVHKPSRTYNDFYTDPDSRFIYDNSFDDSLINTDYLTHLVEEDFRNLLSGSKTINKVNFSIILSILVLFAVLSFVFVRRINKDIKRFLTIFLTIQSKEVKKTIFLLSVLKEILGREEEGGDLSKDNPIEKYFNYRNKQMLDEIIQSNVKSNRKVASHSSINKIYRINYLYLLFLCLCLIVMGGFVGIYYSTALTNIDSIEKQQNTLNIALDNMKRNSLISAQLQALIIDNGTTTIKNVSILESLPIEVGSIDTISNLYNIFLDKNKNLSPEIAQIFFNLNCSEAYSPDYINPNTTQISQCHRLAKGKDRLGLTDIYSLLTQNLKQFLIDYSTSPKTLPDLRTLFGKITTEQIQPLDQCMGFSLLLLNATVKEFEKVTSSLNNQRTILVVVGIIVSILLALITWVFTIKKLVQKEFDKMDMLVLLPPKIIINNHLLKKCVLGSLRF